LGGKRESAGTASKLKRERERQRSERASGAIPVFYSHTLALGAMASSAALCIAVLLLVLAMVNLMPKSLVEGRFLDAGISMVTDQVLPQQQQQTYSSLLPAERFAEVLGNSPSVVSFVAFASKYVFLCFAFLCKLIVCLIDALGRFSLPFYAYVFLREEDVNVFFASSSSSSSTIFFSFFPIRNPSEAVCNIADLFVECWKFHIRQPAMVARYLNQKYRLLFSNSHKNTAFFSRSLSMTTLQY